MGEYELHQDIAEQISNLPTEQAEEVRRYIEELCQADIQREEQRSKYLTFMCCQQTFGVNIQQVIQILRIPPITPLPDSLPYMKGVISLREEMVPVIDLRIRLGREEAAYTDQNCIVILNVQGRSFGAVVDCVCNVETILPEEICLPPQQEERKGNYLTGIAKRDTVILLIDADHLFAAGDLEQMLDVSAKDSLPI